MDLEDLKDLAIQTATLTAKAAVVQALIELQHDLKQINKDNATEPALDLVATYMVSMGATLEAT
jgi:hypothetical protein